MKMMTDDPAWALAQRRPWPTPVLADGALRQEALDGDAVELGELGQSLDGYAALAPLVRPHSASCEAAFRSLVDVPKRPSSLLPERPKPGAELPCVFRVANGVGAAAVVWRGHSPSPPSFRPQRPLSRPPVLRLRPAVTTAHDP